MSNLIIEKLPIMNVGDIHSKEKGTGARANANKPDWSLMILRQLAFLIDREEDILDDSKLINDKEMIRFVGLFQEGLASANNLLLDSVAYNLYHFNRVYDRQSEDTLMDSLVPVIEVWEYGLKKYSPFNWAKGMQWSIPIACIIRHIQANLYDKPFDVESKQLHSAHVVCNAMMLAHYDIHYREGDDRPLHVFK